MTTSSLTTEITGTSFFTYETEFHTNFDYDEVELTTRTRELTGTTLPTLDWSSFKSTLRPTPTPNVIDYQYEPLDTAESSNLSSSSMSDVLSIATAVFLVSVILIKVTTLMLYMFTKEKGNKMAIPENHSIREYRSVQLEEMEYTRRPSVVGDSEMTTSLASFRSQENTDKRGFQIRSSISGSRKKGVGSPPRIALPDLPDNVKKEDQKQDVQEVQEDEYCVLRSQWQNSEIIERRNIRFNKKVSLDGTICDLWKGSRGSKQKKKDIFITTPKDFINSRISWEKLVQKCLSLPVSSQTLQVQGFCIESGKILLIHEYFDIKVLREVLSPNEVNNQAEKVLDQLMNYSEQVAAGMEFAFSHGLSHPTLNTSKVCVTHQGQCKLYDFCLTEDAPKIVELIKSQNKFNSEKFPPEFMNKNEYSSASDVWYTAFTIMEIFNQGNIPTTFTEEDTYGIQGEEVSTKPTLCPEPVFEIISACLHSDPSLRPNISKLRADIQQEMSLYLERSTYSTMAGQDEYSTIEEQYMIMKGRVTKPS